MVATGSTNGWNEIVRIGRGLEMPEDPTLHRAAVWWEVFSRLPDEPASRVWATYVADAWERSTVILGELPLAASWLDAPADEMHSRVLDVMTRYESTASDWWGGADDWTQLEAEKSRRLVRIVIAVQQRLVASMVEQGEIASTRVRSRLTHPYVAGYLYGLAANWCDASGIDQRDERCRAEALEIFGEIFGPEHDDEAATIFFERWGADVEYVDGMLHAHEDVNSFRRWQRGVRIQPRMRLFEHLAGGAC